MTYKERVIKAYFHSYSGGKTSSAQEIFGEFNEYCLGTDEIFTREELLKEDDFASKYADMIDEIRERVMFKSTNIIMILNKQDKITGTKNAKAYNHLIWTHFKKFIIGAKKIQKMIKD